MKVIFAEIKKTLRNKWRRYIRVLFPVIVIFLVVNLIEYVLTK